MTMAKEHNIPSRIHVELAWMALHNAISEIQFIEEKEINDSGFQGRFSVL